MSNAPAIRPLGALRRTWIRVICLFSLPRAKRQLAANVALVCVSVAVALVVAEVACRRLLPPIQSAEILESDFSSRLEAERKQGVRAEVDGYEKASLLWVWTRTGRRVRANTRLLIRNHLRGHRDILVRTNELGFRGEALKPKRATRVLFLGDSITLADYLHEQETHVELIAAAARRAGRSLEVVNAGAAGASLAEEIATLSETGLMADPDAVVLGFYLNDFVASPGVVIPTPPRWLAGSRLVRRVLEAHARASLIMPAEDPTGYGPRFAQWRAEASMKLQPSAEGDYRTDRAAFNMLILSAFSDWGSAWSDSIWREVLEPLLWKLKQLTDAHGLKVYIVCFPVSNQVEAQFIEDFPQRKLRELGARMSVPVLDFLPALRARARSSNTPLFYDQCHYTPEGSRVIADAAWEFLRSNGL